MAATFDVHGQWTIHQAPNLQVTVSLDQQQDSTGFLPGIIGGSARSSGPGQPTVDADTVEGVTVNNQFYLLVTWNSGTVAEYHGVFGLTFADIPPGPDAPPPDPQPARLWGVTCDLRNRQNVTTWVSDRGFLAPVVQGP